MARQKAETPKELNTVMQAAKLWNLDPEEIKIASFMTKTFEGKDCLVIIITCPDCQHLIDQALGAIATEKVH